MAVAVVFMTGGVSWEGAMLDNEALREALRSLLISCDVK
jgi:hypothetical protein